MHRISGSDNPDQILPVLKLLEQALPWLRQIGRPPEPKRMPVILTAREELALMGLMSSPCIHRQKPQTP